MKKIFYTLYGLVFLFVFSCVDAASSGVVAEQRVEPSLNAHLKQIVHNGLSDDEIIELINEQEGIDPITFQEFDRNQLDQAVVLSNGRKVVHLDTIRNMMTIGRTLRDPYTRASLSPELISYVRNYAVGQQNIGQQDEPSQQDPVHIHNNLFLARNYSENMDLLPSENYTGDPLGRYEELRRARGRELLAAVENNDASEVRRLVRLDTDLNVANDQGATPLHLAVANQNHEIVGMLLMEGGLQVNAQNVHGATPLHWAVQSGNFNMAYRLLNGGAHLSVQDNNGRTPLHWAAIRRNVPIAMMLATRDPQAATSIRDHDGNLPRDLWRSER